MYAPKSAAKTFGPLAQLGERLHGMEEVESSSLLRSTNSLITAVRIRFDKRLNGRRNAERPSGLLFFCLSMPAIVGEDGVEGVVPISLSKEEEKALQKSADTLKKVIQEAMPS